MGDETRSEVYSPRNGRALAAQRTSLALVGHASDLSIVPSRHWLDDVDAVCFARGDRVAIRDRDGLPRRLLLRVPDPFMSADHGRMVRLHGRWMIESPGSKNGVVVNGRVTRMGLVEVGDVFEVGRSMFLLETVPDQPDPGIDDAELVGAAHVHPLLASFHPSLAAAESALSRIAPSRVPVLLHGETGTGKEVYARAIHESSGRPGPFVAVNCGALSPSLLEAELFGHRRGAFSGAIADRPGFIRSADRGTLFLDEIPELSRAAQVALLRVLEEDEVVAVGDTKPVSVDIRIVAASQRPLICEVDAGNFRSDLYARLLGYETGLPALRERRADIGYIIANLGRRMTSRSLELTPAAFRALLQYDWPRNIRELERYLATAIALSTDGVIDVDHLPPAIAGAMVRAETPPPPTDTEKDAAMRDVLSTKLAEHRGNITAVARDLGKHREQVQRWIRRLGVDIRRFRR